MKAMTKRERQASRAFTAWVFCGFTSAGVLIWSGITGKGTVFWPALVIVAVSIIVLGTGAFIPDE